MIKCNKCGLYRNETDFYLRKTGRVRFPCKKCFVIHNKQYRKIRKLKKVLDSAEKL